MLIKMVASDESGGLGYDQHGDGNDSKPQSQPQPPPSQHENGESSKQSSIFSLTFDEIQSKSGKCLGSMNMDEFLANIWSADENQASSEQPNQGDPQDLTNGKDTTSKLPLPRQGSFSIPTPLCKKTVDEVWSEIDKTRPPPPPDDMSNGEHPQRQSSIGEITLEDFLVKAGVVQESLSQNRMECDPIHPQGGDVNNSNMATNSTMHAGTSSEMGNNMIAPGYLNPQNAMPNNVSSNGYVIAGYPVFGQAKMIVGNPSFGTGNEFEKCHGLPESSWTKNKKRIIDGPLEVVVERRQRRMIKNRESAARSRARKQAYTVELEAEVNNLEVENDKLKQTVAEIELRRRQELKARKQSTKAQRLAAKLRTMRRTVSA
ncbi:ABSCISIC ACID-INSENSITIVE 5-like protein 1 [Argentina anserina]|uniref:ABSCISIC ACID-INSENSITIVE 5-like protein 1 n=1 Tax=Argentina anserina TaxID=57926 RepID=UPI0021764DBC|nr:ABSCISIC ACID-INSENSITIVE 5-like protein 1 [Potentilla anserina]